MYVHDIVLYMKKNKKRLSAKLLIMLVALELIAFSLNMFFEPHSIAAGGATGIAILLTIVGVKFHGPSLGTVILKGVFSAIAGISKAFAKAISWIAKTFVRMLGKIFNSLKKEHPILAVVVTAIVAIIVI